MSLVTANDVTVIRGSILMPLYGVWSADIVIDQPDGTGFEAGTQVTIKSDGGVELVGTVVADRSGSFLDAIHVRVLGGGAGMAKAATVKGYMQPGAYVRDVANALAKDGGETLSSQIDNALLQTNLTAWATQEGSVSAGLVSLLDIIAPTADWRILADGKLWFGDETWPTDDSAYQLIASNPSEKTYDLGVDTFTIVPGVDLQGVGKVNRVEHSLEDGRVRSRIWAELEDEDRGVAGSVQALCRQELHKLDFFTFYDAKIVSQSADGATVDLEPADKRIPKLQRVPLRNGVAATTCKVSAGTFVRLGWDRGNPQYPFACLWQGDETVTRISIAGDTDAARKGDHSDAGTWVFAFTPGPSAALSITYTDPDGTVTTLASGSGAVLAKAKLTEGSTKVGLG